METHIAGKKLEELKAKADAAYIAAANPAVIIELIRMAREGM